MTTECKAITFKLAVLEATTTSTQTLELPWLGLTPVITRFVHVGRCSTNRARKVYVLMRDEKEERKEQTQSNKQQGKATQHTQGSHYELTRVGLEPTALYTLDTCTCMHICM